MIPPGAPGLTLQADPIAIPRTGRATLIVTLRDGAGVAIAGALVNVTTTLGRLQDATLRTDAQGHAFTALLADGATGRARVAVEANGTTASTDVDLGQGVTLSLRAAPASITPDGSTTVTLLATTADGRPVAIGTVVVFSTTLGTLDLERGVVAETALATTILRGAGATGTAQVSAQVEGFRERALLDVPIQP